MEAILISDPGLLATDGTSTGTTVIKPTVAGPGGFIPIARTAPLGNRVIFVGEGSGYNELWTTDGTAAGTSLIVALPASSIDDGGYANADDLTPVGDKVVFSYTDGSVPGSGAALWTTDGTAAGTQMISGVNNPSLGPDSGLLTNGQLIFVSADGLQVTDGTAAGTELLVAGSKNFVPDQNGTMASIGSQVLFPAVSPGVINGTGVAPHLWTTDGTQAGTRSIAVFSGNADDVTLYDFVSLGAKALFVDAGSLWVSDGTSTGTFSLSAATNPDLSTGAKIGGKLIFVSNAGLCITDGTAGGTKVLVPADPVTGFNPDSQVPMAQLGSEVVFVAAQGAGEPVQIWKTDGTESGTRLVATLPDNNPSAGVGQLASIGNYVLISDYDGTEASLWSTDGTAAGTTVISEGLVTSLAATTEIPCFLRGTRIRTLRGDVAVEALTVGEMILGVRSGCVQAVKWIGYRRIVAATHGNPTDLWPVCVRAGAISDWVPSRDVWLSPEHAVFLHGALVPVRHLVNGVTIVQVPMSEMVYYHVELPVHDLMLSEGLLSESYLDTGNRAHFDNAESMENAHREVGADLANQVWHALACAPQVRGGAELSAIRAGLMQQARRIGAPRIAEYA